MKTTYLNMAGAVLCVLLLVNLAESQTIDSGKKPGSAKKSGGSGPAPPPGGSQPPGGGSDGSGKKKGAGSDIGGANKRDSWRKDINDSNKHKLVVNKSDVKKARDADPRRLRQRDPRRSRRGERKSRYDWKIREARPRPLLLP